jgi:hypothetical protein
VFFEVRSSVAVVEIMVDLIGDGLGGEAMGGTDLRRLRGLSFTPGRQGSFSLQLRVLDANGCTDTTGVARTVLVR